MQTSVSRETQLFHNTPCLISQNVVSFFGLIAVVSDFVFKLFSPHTISRVTKYYEHQIKAPLQPSFHIFLIIYFEDSCLRSRSWSHFLNGKSPSAKLLAVLQMWWSKRDYITTMRCSAAEYHKMKVVEHKYFKNRNYKPHSKKSCYA